jgi:hypothetical protein
MEDMLRVLRLLGSRYEKELTSVSANQLVELKGTWHMGSEIRTRLTDLS